VTEPPGGTVGPVERHLSGARFQRAATAVLSLVALAALLATLAAGDFRPLLSRGTEPLSVFMQKAGAASILTMIAVAGTLGLYLAWRGHRRMLTRWLGLSSSALACGFAVFLALRSFALLKGMREAGIEAWLPTMAAVLVFAIAMMAVWMFSTVRFFIMFPKPVKLGGVDFASEDWNRLQWRGAWSWSWLRSRGAFALLVDCVLIYMVCTKDMLSSDRWAYIAGYLTIWSPFAILNAKQAVLDEAGRRAIRWVLAGQLVWQIAFIVSMLAIVISRDAGILVHGSWDELNAFTQGYFATMFSGFVTVLLVSLAFSIFYDGTMDPDLMVTRTWLLAALGMGSGAMFVMVERVLAGVLADWLQLSTVDALTIVAMVTAVLIYPLRHRAEAFVRGLAERWQSDTAIAKGERQEASVVFADLSGYTRLTEQDEQAALVMAGVFHRDAYQAARQHEGRVIKTIGDAVMLRFADADAAYGALQVLRETFNAHIAALSMAPLPIHAAIHHGEVVQAPNGDIFGAAVNLAARLLGAAGPDEIVASHAAVKGRALESHGVFMGERAFKNVAAPVGFYRIA
jgi:class 3 adenylate cyclase